MSEKDAAVPRLKSGIKHLLTRHRQGSCKNLFIFSTARSGSTLLAELLATQGKFKLVNEPCDLRQPVMREHLQISSWEDLFRPESKPRIRAHLQSFIEDTDRDLRFKRETPFTQFWHWRTDRVIFKILFLGEDDMDWYRLAFDAELLFLLRHPIPVALSREELPRLNSFLVEPYASHFSREQLEFARTIVAGGDAFEKAILDWCLQNAVPLRQRHDEWLLVSYEQLVIEPEVVISHLARRLGLPHPHKMQAQVLKASNSTGKSNAGTQSMLRDPQKLRGNRRWLIERWREKITETQERRAFDILQRFEIDFYERGSFMPAARYLLGSP